MKMFRHLIIARFPTSMQEHVMQAKLCTVKELAAHLRLSSSYIYKQVEARQFPHFRCGGAIRFTQDHVTKIIQMHTVEILEPHTEMQQTVAKNTQKTNFVGGV